MLIDQNWVKINIDEIMNKFVIINPEFQGSTNKKCSARSYHKKKMLESMDTLTYRALYHLCKDERYQNMIIAKKRLFNKLVTAEQKIERAREIIIGEFTMDSREYRLFIGEF